MWLPSSRRSKPLAVILKRPRRGLSRHQFHHLPINFSSPTPPKAPHCSPLLLSDSTIKRIVLLCAIRILRFHQVQLVFRHLSPLLRNIGSDSAVTSTLYMLCEEANRELEVSALVSKLIESSKSRCSHSYSTTLSGPMHPQRHARDRSPRAASLCQYLHCTQLERRVLALTQYCGL